ncbi:ANXA6 [Symbiodinium natans]|uniref:ANXA6 protein n=1 Tax=Symbiodinium natans TaxID=878477 RepID=A0A812LMA2_9DINO|nr:ANXA6 [Symbiodinium natans]
MSRGLEVRSRRFLGGTLCSATDSRTLVQNPAGLWSRIQCRNTCRASLQATTAPSKKTCSANPTMIMLGGGARTLIVECPFRRMHIGQVLSLCPPEECLLSGFPCELLCLAIQMQGTILCGQSLGGTVALTIAVRLTTCGLCVHGVVCLDSRCDRFYDLFSAWPRLPPTLPHSLTSVHFRLAASRAEDYVDSLVPRGQLSGRFPNTADAAKGWHCRATWRSQRLLADAGHYGMAQSHAWDINRCIQAEIARSRDPKNSRE